MNLAMENIVVKSLIDALIGYIFFTSYVDQPEVTKGDVQLYSSIGNSVNITATTKIKGNPTPNITWVSPNITEIMPGGRYYQSPDTPGILTINDLQLSDFGVYRFIASNGVGNDATLDISLTLLGKLAICSCIV